MFRKKKGEKLEAIAMLVWVFVVKVGDRTDFEKTH